MRLEIASSKAVRYAVQNWHYTKSVPNVGLAFAVFNNENEFCGVICYGVGATANIARPYGLQQGQVVELLRVALNGKQKQTSQALAKSLRLLKKKSPSVKLAVSYADSEQNHNGIIYQATNWIYTGFSTDSNLVIDGQRKHRRSVSSKYGTSSAQKIRSLGHCVQVIKTKPKWKYIYPLDKRDREKYIHLAKPYPRA
tara:strand:+ start:245 stop:835 length:591 start_codon:yes stop_codon:yes gene_type:complete